MIKQLTERLIDLQKNHAHLLFIVFALITLALLPGIGLLIGNVEPSLEKVLPQHTPEIEAMNDMRDLFGTDVIYIVFESYDMREENIEQYFDTLSQSLLSHEQIESARYTQSNDLKSMYVFEVQTSVGANADQIRSIITDIEEILYSLESTNPGMTYELTGFSTIDKKTFEVIISDFQRITLVSFLAVALVVFFTFRNWKKTLLPLLIVMIALIWTLGIVGYLGLTLTVVSMVAAAMILGLGIDFGIHVTHTYERGDDPNQSLEKTMRELLRAMIGASLTTIAGFLSLLFGFLPAMQTLGIILSVGIFSTLLGASLLLPTLLYKIDREGYL